MDLVQTLFRQPTDRVTRTAAEPDRRTRRGPRARGPTARGWCHRRVDLVSYWTVSTVKLDLTCGRSAKRWRHTRRTAKEGRQKAVAASATHVGVHRRPFGACLTESMLVFAVTSSGTRLVRPDSWVVEHRTEFNPLGKRNDRQRKPSIDGHHTTLTTIKTTRMSCCFSDKRSLVINNC